MLFSVVHTIIWTSGLLQVVEVGHFLVKTTPISTASTLISSVTMCVIAINVKMKTIVFSTGLLTDHLNRVRFYCSTKLPSEGVI